MIMAYEEALKSYKEEGRLPDDDRIEDLDNDLLIKISNLGWNASYEQGYKEASIIRRKTFRFQDHIFAKIY